MSNNEEEVFEERFPREFYPQRAAIRMGWQAARDHYAPKLPPLKDVELANAAQAYGCGTADHLQTLSVIKALEIIGAFGEAPTLTEREFIRILDNHSDDDVDELSLVAALRAAGVRFKEEA